MTFWSRSHSLQRKIIAAIVMVGLLPLTLLLALTYVEERRALREMTGANFKEVAVEAARRIEMQVSRGMNEAQQLATTPLLHTAVTEANRTYEGKDARNIQGMIKDWQQRWRQRDQAKRVSPLHQSHRHQLSHPVARYPQIGLYRDPGDRQPGGTGGQFHSTSGVFLREDAVVASGGQRGKPQGLCQRDHL